MYWLILLFKDTSLRNKLLTNKPFTGPEMEYLRARLRYLDEKDKIEWDKIPLITAFLNDLESRQ